MNYPLLQIPFSGDALSAVQDFHCGDEPWALEVAEYLKNAAHVAEWVKNQTAEAWLYITPEGELVGYGTLGQRSWRWPNAKKSPRQPINVIPAVGVATAFQGQPSGQGATRYADQILDHLRSEAMKHTERWPVLGLCVHPGNARAIRWYERVGFERLSSDYTDPETKTVYWRMALALVDIDAQGKVIAPIPTAHAVSANQRSEPTATSDTAVDSDTVTDVIAAPLDASQAPEQQAKKQVIKAKHTKNARPRHKPRSKR